MSRPPSSLDPLLRPTSVAVIGASRRRGTIGAEVFLNLIKVGFPGAIYPVNPGATVVQSVRAYASVELIPDPVDLAVLVVPAEQVLDAVESCGRKGVRALVVISAGFGETGPAGRALQEQLVRRVRELGLRMVGPNCLGVVNADPSVNLHATFAPTWPPFGNVAFSSQSGALGLAILDHARQLGVGISQFVSVGNAADVSAVDLIADWEHDPATRVILLYLESLGDPRRLLPLARRVARHKPIVVVKSGRTAAGARAASSHTGSLAGADVAVDALLGRAGILRTDTIEELFDVAMLLANQPVPRGRRVAILTNAGGPGIMASDACESRGLEVVPLQSATEAALAGFLPPEASVHNPVDMIASASAASYEQALALLLDDPGVDAVLVIFVTPIVTDPADVAAAIVRAGRRRTEAGRAPKTVVTCLMGTHGVPAALLSLREGRFPSYRFPEAAARALSVAARHGVWLNEPEGEIPELTGIEAAASTPLRQVGAPRWITPEEVEALMRAYGVPCPRTRVARSAEEAAAAAIALGGRVAVKLLSSSLVHKSDVGGVRLGVEGSGAAAAWCDIAARLTELGHRDGMEGVTVSEMVPSGVELLVGATVDPVYGPMVAFGIGGVQVELWKDLVFRLAPLRDVDAAAMLDGIRARALLDGFRGSPPVNRAALQDLLLRVSRMMMDHPELVELDLNPVIALPDGKLVVVDARVRVG